MRPGMRVLELGCGTGGITRLLLDRGASVTAVDGSRQMLARARWRAPQATFIHARLEKLDVEGTFDRVLFAFVLHELTADDRKLALAAAREKLAPDGLLGILDHAVPHTRGLATAWRSFLLRMEPPTVADCIKTGYEAELATAGFELVGRHALAGGTAQFLLAKPHHQIG
jgi:ubiquinone/menaquinone biosynthesis C-methylase UbiE